MSLIAAPESPHDLWQRRPGYDAGRLDYPEEVYQILALSLRPAGGHIGSGDRPRDRAGHPPAQVEPVMYLSWTRRIPALVTRRIMMSQGSFVAAMSEVPGRLK